MVFEFGLADENQARYIQNQTDQLVKYIQEKQFFEAFEVSLDLLPGITYHFVNKYLALGHEKIIH